MISPSEQCQICELLPNIPEALTIDENNLWSINLGAQDQSCLGRTYITLKRHASELDELTVQEEDSLRIMRNGVIRAIRQQFNPITFNISCLKNDAFRHDPDSTPPSAAHVHWHVIPRYGTQPIKFASELFQDPSPGRYLSAQREKKAVSDEVAAKITNAIRSSYVI
jgi:diadenosine tetraphosphate (Ap4A) HIT family hydrolase